MKFNFRKIASVLASAVMIGSTVGTALAATYPAPFVVGGAASSAVVVTSGTHLGASVDLFAAIDLQSALQGLVTASSTTTAGTVSGEAIALFSGSSKLYVNDSLNSVRSVATKVDMPTVLADGSFSGNVDATYTQTIYPAAPKLIYAKQPTSSDDPQFGYGLTTSTGSDYLYNATITFNKAVNLTHADTKNQKLTLFGKTFTISSSTDSTTLVLLKEATTVSLDSQTSTSQKATVGGVEYTLTLISASEGVSATIQVTNAAGTSDQKTISVGQAKKVNGVTIAVSTANSNNLKYAASIVAGAEKFNFASGQAVTYGDDATTIDGTYVLFDDTGLDQMTKMIFSANAKNSDSDAILAGQAFTDPVFGSFKIDFSGLNAPENGTARDTIKVYHSSDDKILLDITDYNGQAKTGLQVIVNKSDGVGYKMQWDSDGHQIALAENVALNRSDYAVIGNENEGHLIKVSQITNQTTGYSNDAVKFQDIFSGDTYTSTLTADGTGTVTIGGKVYDVKYFGDSTLSDDAKTVRLGYPDSSSANDMVIYPTISTSKGAKLMLYKPLNITLSNWDGMNTQLTGNIKIPNGANAYQSVAVALRSAGGSGNFTIDSTLLGNGTGVTQVALTNTGLKFNFSIAGHTTSNVTTVFLVHPRTGNYITTPAIVVFEEKDDNSVYNNIVVTPSTSATNKIGLNQVDRTWLPVVTTGSTSFRDTLNSNSKITKSADLWGTIVSEDTSASDQRDASISYPDDQVYAQVYIAAIGASITPGTSSSGGGTVLVVKDTDVSSVSAKNLIVVGGSCINKVAAKILGSETPICGADFTTKTNVDAGKYIIKAVASPYNSAKTAVLVAGYEAEQTKLAVAALKAGAVTDVGTNIVGPTVA